MVVIKTVGSSNLQYLAGSRCCIQPSTWWTVQGGVTQPGKLHRAHWMQHHHISRTICMTPVNVHPGKH